MTIILTIIASFLGVTNLRLLYLYKQEQKITKKLDSLKNIKNDIKTFREQKSQMENLVNSLKSEILKGQTLVSDLQNSKSQLEEQLDHLKIKLAKSETSLTELTSQNSEAEDNFLQLEMHIQNSKSEITKLNREVSQFRIEKEIAETIAETSEIIVVKPDEIEVPRREIKYIGYQPNTIFKQVTPTNYPFVSMPLENSVIKFPRKIAEGRIGIRGYKEADFDIYIKRYFSNNGALKFFNDRFLFISDNTKPYIPDHVLTDENNNLNLFIDIEIDEPYEGFGRLSTHIKGKDNSRNDYFNKFGWLVIRFAEIQIEKNILGCCKHIAEVIKSINPNFQIHEDLLNAEDVFNVPMWDKLQADKWAKEKERERYLGILRFGQREGGGIDTSNLIANLDDKNSEANVFQAEIPFEEETLSINIRNKHKKDDDIKFDKEKHEYYIKGNPNTISGTTFIHKFFPEFDGPRIAAIVANNRGITTEEVLKEWEDNRLQAAKDGTELHSDIEQYFDNKTTNNKREFQHFLEFLNTIENLELYRTEWRIFDDILMLAGTADTIFRKNDGTFAIYDWKRSKEIKENGHPIFGGGGGATQKGIGVCDDKEDCNHQHYCLQLNLYKRILEEHYFGEGQVSEMYFVQLHPNFETYNLYKVPDMQDKINEMCTELMTLNN